MFKRITCVLAVLAVLFCISPAASAETVYITEARGSDFTSDTYLAQKLDEIFSGSLGLYTDAQCTDEASVPLGSSRAKVGTTYYVKEQCSGALFSGSSCYIYANAVYNTLFGDVPYHGYSSTWESSECAASAKSSVSYDDFTTWGIKLGALMRTTPNKDGSYSSNYGHSIIILGYDESGVTYLEGNGDGNGLVRITQRSWSSFNSALMSNRGYVMCFIVNPLYEGGDTPQETPAGDPSENKPTDTVPSPSVVNNNTPTANKSEYIGYFKAVRDYGGFSDVSLSDWYYDSVKLSYELGIFSGRDIKSFCPGGNVTVAEAVTIAARLCSYYWADEYDFSASGQWYEPYYTYLSKWGVSVPDKAPSEAITRGEFAELIYKMIPSKEFSETVISVTLYDISPDSAAYALAKAGVIIGSDNLFRPNDKITRSEGAAICARIANTELRSK